MHYKKLAEKLQEKYSSPRYSAWLRRRGIRERIRYFHRKARNIVEDWVKKLSHEIVVLSKQNQLAIAREDLTGLIENLKKLPRDHKVALLMLSYRRLEYWIDWQAEKHGVPVIVVEPRGTSTTCPRCGSKMRENGYRTLKCLVCGFEADRDRVALLNIERKTLSKMGGALAPSTAPPGDRCKPESMGRTSEPPKGNPRPLGRGGGQCTYALAEGCVF